jgi:hypothetical protein
MLGEQQVAIIRGTFRIEGPGRGSHRVKQLAGSPVFGTKPSCRAARGDRLDEAWLRCSPMPATIPRRSARLCAAWSV